MNEQGETISNSSISIPEENFTLQLTLSLFENKNVFFVILWLYKYSSAFKLYANKIICVHNVYRDVKTNQYFL